MRRSGENSALAERLHNRLTDRSRKAQATGEWKEQYFPIRPEGSDYSPRSGTSVVDISQVSLVGIDATTGGMLVGP